MCVGEDEMGEVESGKGRQSGEMPKEKGRRERGRRNAQREEKFSTST